MSPEDQKQLKALEEKQRQAKLKKSMKDDGIDIMKTSDNPDFDNKSNEDNMDLMK